MSRSADTVRAAQRHEKLRELMVTRVQRAVGFDLSPNQQSFAEQEIDLMLHRGDCTEGSLQKVAAALRALQTGAGDGQQQRGAPAASQGRQHEKPSRKHAADASRAAATPQPTATAQPPAAPRSVVEAARIANEAVRPGQPTALSTSALYQFDDDGDDDLYSSKHRVRVPRPKEVHADDLWAMLAKKGLEEHNAQVIAQRRALKRKEVEQSKFLDQQVTIRHQQQRKVVEDEHRFVAEERRQTERFFEEEKVLQAKKREKLVEERHSRDAQLQEARLRHEKEARIREQEKVQAVKIIEEELAKEQAAAEERRVKAKVEVKKFEQFNEQFQKAKMAERMKERDLEKESQRVYLERLAKQEADREKALQAMHERQHRQQAIAFQMQTTIQEKAAEDERKAEAYAAAVDARTKEAERAKREKAEADRMKFKQYLTIQILDRDKQALARQEELRRERDDVLKQAERAEAEIAERKRLEQQKKLQQRQAIETQVAQRASIRREVFMSDTERQLNAKLLTRVSPTSA